MKAVLGACAIALLLGGCATAAKPTAAELGRLPVVEFGHPVPSGDFVLYFPAGKPVPFTVSATGNGFARGLEREFDVLLSRDIYVHKKWVSFDKATWYNGPEAIDFKLGVRIPGYEHPKPGSIDINMQIKK